MSSTWLIRQCPPNNPRSRKQTEKSADLRLLAMANKKMFSSRIFFKRFLSYSPNAAEFKVAYDKLLEESRNDKNVLRLFNGVRSGERSLLAESITLIESTNSLKQKKSERLLTLLLDDEQQRRKRDGKKAKSMRIGKL